MNKLYSLQSGTDIRGVAYKDANSELDITLSEEEVKIIVKGFATWLKEKYKKNTLKISIGTDSRVTGEKFRQVCVETFINLGIDVVDCGISSTPAMFMSTIMESYNCDGAIMFTASHMPYIYNGIKMFTKDGGLEKNDVKAIIDICVSQIFIDASKKGSLIQKDLLEDYSNTLVSMIRREVNSSQNYERPFENIKIVVDAGNGSGGFFVDKVLKKLGANTEGSQFLEPDGMFPNHIPNPENKEAMESISRATLMNKADLGIIFDTDVDRAAIVASNGKAINKNALIAVISKIVLESYPNSTIVTDSVTSNGLADFIAKNGGIHHRFKRGYKNVINESKRLNEENIESPLAIETSGHAAMKENYFLDDGAYLIAKILVKVAKLKAENKDIIELISDLKESKEDVEYRIKINEPEFKDYAEKIISDLKQINYGAYNWNLVEKNFEGVRFNCDSEEEKGWFLLRASLHEPLIVLNIESDVVGGCQSIYKKVTNFLSAYNLD